MIEATLYMYSNYFLNNRIFDLTNKTVNRDNCLYAYYLLKQKLKKHNINLATQDINPSSESLFTLYINIPKGNIYKNNKKKQFLFLSEPVVVKSSNWNYKNHEYFEKIFTYNDDLIDDVKYFKLNYPNTIPKNINYDTSKKDKFCTMIVANKFSMHKSELYSERRNIIRWFEHNYPDDFDLYGVNWDKYVFNKPLVFLNYFRFIRNFSSKILKRNYISYKGKIESKRPVLRRYKYSVAFENSNNTPGYISEKIFDCFFAGCIPIYLGAPNVTKHIPSNAFIDLRKFNNYEKMYQYIKNMPHNEYLNYINNIKSFLESDKMHKFGADHFSDKIIKEILECVK